MSEFAVPENIKKSARKKPRRPFSGEGRVGAEDEAALAAFNAPTIEALNRRVELVEKAYRAQHGYRPSPSLALDVSRAPVTEQQIDNELFHPKKTTISLSARAGLQDFLARPQPSSSRGLTFSEDAEARQLDSAQGREGDPELAAASFVEQGPAPTHNFSRDYMGGKTVQPTQGRKPTYAEEYARRSEEFLREDYRLYIDQTKGMTPEEEERFLRGNPYSAPPDGLDRIMHEVIGDSQVASNVTASFRPLKDTAKGLGTMFFGVGLDVRDVVTESIRLGRELPGMRYAAKVWAPATLGTSLLLDPDIPLPEIYEREILPERSIFIAKALGEAFKDPYVNPSWSNSLWYVLDALSLLSVVGGVGARVFQAGRVFKGLDQADDIADATRRLKAMYRQRGVIDETPPGVFATQVGAWRKEDNIEETASLLVELDRMKAAVADAGMGERLNASMRSVLKQPLPGTYQLGVGSNTQDLLLSASAGWRQIEKAMAGARQRGYERRVLVPSAHRKMGSGMINSKLRFFSTEGKLSRARAYSMELDFAIETARTKRINRWRNQTVWTESVWKQMISGGGTQKAWRSWKQAAVPRTEHVGVQKAIQMRLAYPELDGAGAAAKWGSFHGARIVTLTDELSGLKLKRGSPKLDGAGREKINRDIRAVEREISAHEAQLVAIKSGREWLDRADRNDLPEDVRKLFVATEDVLDDLAKAREALGVLPEQMQWRLQAQRTYLDHGAEDPDVLYQLHGEETLDALIDAERMNLRDLQLRLGRANKTDVSTGTTKATLPLGEKGSRTEVRTVDKIDGLEAEIVASRTRIGDLNDASLDPRLAEDPKAVLEPLGVKDADLVRTRKGLGPAPEGTRYIPLQGIADELIENYSPSGTRVGKYGVVPAQAPPQLRYSFTGRSLHFGRYRIDVSNMATEQLRQTIRYGLKQEHYDTLWMSGKAMPEEIPAQFRLPIRDSRNISDLQKKVISELEEGIFDVHQADEIARAGGARELDAAIPAHYESGKVRGGWNYKDNEAFKQAVIDAEEIRWIDSRELVAPHSSPHGKIFKALANANGIVRDVTLYVRPAYATNFVGAAVMAFFHQGMALPANYGRALHMSSLYGDDVNDLIRSMAGTSKTAAYAPEGASVHVWSRWLRDNWQEVTDNPFRNAAVINELRKRNIPITREAILDPKNRRKVREATRRARRAMVDFDNLTPFEREWMRHLVFIYAWITRSTFWSFGTIRDRPVKVGVTARAGQLTEEEIDERIGPEQEWVDDLSRYVSDSEYIPFLPGIAKGPNAWQNTQSFNTLSAAPEFAETVVGMFEDGRPGVPELLQPVVKLTAGLMGLSPDQYRQEPALGFTKWLAKGGGPGKAAAYFLEDLPQLSPTVRQARLNKFDEPGMPDITRADGLRAYLNDFEDAPTFLPRQGALGENWTLIFGSWTPAEQNTFVRLARTLSDVRENDPELADDVSLAIDKLWKGSQSRLIASPVTPGIELNMEVGTEIKKEKRRMAETTAQDSGELPWRQKLEATINALSNMGLITEEETGEAEAYSKKLANNKKGRLEGARYREQLLYDHAEKQEMDRWNERVKQVSSFMLPTQEGQDDLLESDLLVYREGVELGKHSTVDLSRFETLVAANDDVRRAYALLFSLYEDHEDSMRPDEDAVQEESEYQEGWRKHREWVSENGSGAVVIDGVEYPSFEELDWIRLDPEERGIRVMDLVGRRAWSANTSFMKQALGRPTSDGAAAGWVAFDEVVAEIEAPVGSGEWATGKKITRKRLIELGHSDGDEDFPGFESDFAFAKETTLGERFLALASYSTWKLEWDAFQSVMIDKETGAITKRESFIEQLEAAVDGHKSDPSGAKEEWGRYVREEVRPALGLKNASGGLVNQDVIDLASDHNGQKKPLGFFHRLIGR